MTTRARAAASVAPPPLPPALRLVLGLATLVLIGTLLLMLPGASTGGGLSWNQALFTATSALTVTGLATITPVTDLTLFGQLVLLLLIQIGGVGFMVVAVVLLRLLGRRVGLADRLALKDSLGLLSPAAIVKLTRRVLYTVLVIEALGAAALYLHWRGDSRLSEGQALFFAVFHAVSAFCNAGFDLFSGTPGFSDGIPRDNVTLLILGLLIFLGGLGIPVIADLLTYPWQRRLSLHTRLTLWVVAFLVLSGTVGFFAAEFRAGGALAGEHPLRALLICLFQSVAARTAGFWGIAEFTALTPASQLLMITLMFIGCAPASMGGGITTGTFAALAISLWSYARGMPSATFGGRSLGRDTARKAGAVLTISLFVVLLATWLLLLTNDVALDAATFEVVSAFATCGLTLGLTPQLNLFGQLLICLVMFWGRLGALTIILALAAQQGRPQPVQYPEEPILIG
jgi:trk system potassium uptake protein TrkH